MLSVSAVSAHYGRIQALEGVSLTVQQGEIVALIGANGAGKTTLLRTISGVMHPSSGEVEFEGSAISRLPAEKVVGLGMSHVPENRQVFGTMTVAENLALGAFRRRPNKADFASDVSRIYELFPVLAERQAQKAGTLSGGEQQMLALARGLMARPRLMLMDEPSLGLAPLIVKGLFEIVAELRDQGMTFLLVEQNAHAALNLADRGYLMEVGSVVLDGPAAELLQDDRVHAAYLGGSTT